MTNPPTEFNHCFRGRPGRENIHPIDHVKDVDNGSFEFGADPDEIFEDGLESGDTSAWLSSVP